MILKISDNLGRGIPYTYDGGSLTVAAADIPFGTEYIDVKADGFSAKAGEKGYYVIADADRCGSRLCCFNDKSDGERIFEQALMPIFGVKNRNGCTLCIVEGLAALFHIVFGVKDKEYYIYPRFMLNGNEAYENIKIKFVSMPTDSTYSDMAVEYRNYKLKRGDCCPLADRMKERETLAYAAKSPEIRIRMGWKPAPPKIMEQTAENEPEMYTACTFDRVYEFVDELKRQGVEKAELCLVGWNVSGHDGRYPQLFPVEERLGGEPALRRLIVHAKECGYKIVCHTNSTDCYSIADRFTEDIVCRCADGSLSINPQGWSGGRMYNLCPKCALKFAEEDLPRVADLGFDGIHYIDVMSVVPLRWCHDKNHPSNPDETLECYNKIMKLCHERFGGFASEGVFDFCAKYLDYGLYISWPPKEDEMTDREIPLWSIVYHGIILANPTTDTVNYNIKDKKNGLKVAECGARPSFYVYSKFMKGGNQDDWLGREDLVLDTDDDMRFAARKIKDACDEYKAAAELQAEFIERHEEVSDNVYRVSYSNGAQITVDYNSESYTVSFAEE